MLIKTPKINTIEKITKEKTKEGNNNNNSN